MKHFNIADARIVIKDSGALEFVLAARMEAALRKIPAIERAIQARSGGFLLPRISGHNISPDNARFRFTRLYLPGNNPGMMLNAGIHEPDGIILDLEDSVAPQAKDEARILVRNALRNLDFYGAERMVRINRLPLGFTDLEAVIPQQPDLVLIPKAEDPEDIIEVDKKIREIRDSSAKHGNSSPAGGKNTGDSANSSERPVFIMPILESALGIEKAFEIATASKNIVAMAIGLEDYTADIGVQRTEEGDESFFARTRLVNACKAAGLQAIDSVYSDVGNEEGLRETVLRSRALGFEGMGCIHPRQVPVVKNAFQPDENEIKKAKALVMAFEEAERNGLAVVSLGSKMIDPPVVRRAQRTIGLALQMDLIPENWREEDE